MTAGQVYTAQLVCKTFYMLNNKARACMCVCVCVSVCVYVGVCRPVAEGQCELPLDVLLIALAEQTEELCLEAGLQQAVCAG